MLSVYTNLIQLTKIFHKYAVKHATLGMTVEEFQQFLIEYQQVRTTIWLHQLVVATQLL